MSRLSVLALAAAGFGLAGCADSNKVTEPTTALSPSQGASFDQLAWENPRHEMPTKSQAAANARPGNSGGGGGTGIYYHGGPVLLNATNVAAVYWSSSAIYNNGPSSPSS